ncbi:MAG: type II secretion system protein, partial [Candidatus Hydrogenedentes bacterium]|nr:type II secretion system protein [Candidatus Hydrogenedentota bacterium]
MLCICPSSRWQTLSAGNKHPAERRLTNMKREFGFTLVELLVVIAI